MVFFPLAFVLRIAAGAWVMITLVKLLEISTYSKALREMGDRLTEGEKANLEERIRQRLFS